MAATTFYENVHTVVDWSYVRDPVGYLRGLRNTSSWFDDALKIQEEFMVLREQYAEFAPPYHRYLYDSERTATQGMVYSPSGVFLGSYNSLIGWYSLHDVLNPKLGPITYLPKPEREYHPLSPIRPVMALQYFRQDPFIQWDNLIITYAGGYDIESLVRSRNYGKSTVDTTGQIDLLSPPGYDTNVTTFAPTVTAWDKIEDGQVTSYKIRWSDGTETISQDVPITGSAKDKVYTVKDTVNTTQVYYDSDGTSNPSTVDAFLSVPASVDNCSASSSSSGSKAMEAFKGEAGEGWLSANGDTSNIWLMYDFGSIGAVLNKWRLMGHKTVANCSPKRFRIEATNAADLSTWTPLFIKYQDSPYKMLGLGEWSEWFGFTNSTSYRYYRLFILESYGG